MTATSVERLHEQAVIDLAERGYHVFPVRAGAKTPLTTNGWKDATRDERKILQWWDRNPDANIGVACGTSGIVVFDIDSKSGANPTEILKERDLHGAPFVLTGKAPAASAEHPNSLEGVRGAHVYFRGNLKTGPVSVVGCEIRGDGAYVIAPPSSHTSGVRYTGQLPAVAALPEVPAWLLELVAQRNRNGKPAAPVDEIIPHGEQHSTLVSMAGSMRNRGMDADEIEAALQITNRKRCEVPAPPENIRKIAESIAKYAPGKALNGVVIPKPAPANIAQARRELDDLLGLGSRDMHVTNARIYGRGSQASLEIDVSNGETLTFGSLREMMRPQTLIAEVAACTGVKITLKQPQCTDVLTLAREIAEHVDTDSENDIAREWGQDFLAIAEVLDLDITDQAQRWRAFEILHERDPWGSGRETGDHSAAVPLVLRHEDGSRYVRTLWFERYLKARDASVSRQAIGARMARVGWTRRGSSDGRGEIRATAPDRPTSRKYPFWIVAEGWEGTA